MDFKYPKKEKLKSKKTIELLFTEGKSVAKYPLRLVYSKTQNQEEKLLFGVSVSKKHFKNAVDRNYYKPYTGPSGHIICRFVFLPIQRAIDVSRNP
jgi:ribonuclease P protein component